MRKFVVAMVGFGALAVAAEAGVVCATPQEMKVLQSAALQQQLMVAALSCHQSEDYNRFVTAYHGRLLESDQALKAFFAARPRGEDYNAYKTRIANRVSLRSLHDARFCDSAQKVFDMALGRDTERNGLAPEPPQLIDTGYEGCRPVDDAVIAAEVIPRPVARPETKLAMAPKPMPRPATAKPVVKPAPTRLASLQIAKPAPAPKPVVTDEASHALALAPRPAMATVAPKPVQVATAAPKPLKVATALPKPVPVGAPKPLPKLASAMPPPPRSMPATSPQTAHAQPPDFDQPTADEDPYAAAGPPQDYGEPEPYAGAEPPPWRYPDRQTADDQPADRQTDDRQVDDRQNGDRQNGDRQWADRPSNDDPSADDHIPNAYRPGAQWMGDSPAGWRPTAAAAWRPYYPPPPRWRRPRGSFLVLAPDGRWVVVIGHQRRWVRD